MTNRTHRIVIIAAVTIILTQISLFFFADNYWLFSVMASSRPPHLMDFRNIQAAIECSNNYNVLQTNPCDFLNRPMNYPRIWLLFKLSETQMKLLFVALYLCYCIVLYKLFLKKGSFNGILSYFLFFYFIFSPATQLLFERMNNDWMIFLLLYLFCLLKVNNYKIFAALLLLVAIVLKLYPIVAISAYLFVNRSDSFNKVIVPLLLSASLGYFWITRDDIADIARSVPSFTGESYGFNVMVLYFKKYIVHMSAIKTVAILLMTLCYLRFYVYFLVTRVLLPASATLISGLKSGEVDLLKKHLFIAGGSVFLFTYALGTNFDYRLIFLVFTLPFLISFYQKSYRVAILTVLVLLCFLSKYSSNVLNEFLIIFPVAIFFFLLFLRLILELVSELHVTLNRYISFSFFKKLTGTGNLKNNHI